MCLNVTAVLCWCVPCSYSAADMSGKALCKRALQREMRLEPNPDIPLVGFIGRLDYQKGPDLVLDALPNLSNLDCQVCCVAA
jgi:starch synthase